MKFRVGFASLATLKSQSEITYFGSIYLCTVAGSVIAIIWVCRLWFLIICVILLKKMSVGECQMKCMYYFRGH